MPIGKNSIKRAANGYSKVVTSAPDMENSTVIANPSEQVIEKMIPEAVKDKKPAAAKAAAKKSTGSTKGKKKPAEEKIEHGYVNLGGELPYYLL